MGKGSNTTTQQASGVSSTSPSAPAYQAYLDLMNRAGGVASTPYQGYTGQEVAPVNDQQSAGIGTINQATGDVALAGAPLSQTAIQTYMNPYTQDVVNATQADFDVQNQRANSTVTGNAAAQGALGGDRVGVAQALTQEGLNRSQAPIIAGLRSSGYNQAVQTAVGQQTEALRAAQALSNQGQQQMAAGQVQQMTQQNQDMQNRADYYQQQGYPFQVAQWLAGIDTGVGSQMGGTSTNNTQGQTQGPTPNTFAQIAGMGLAGFAMSDRRLKENVQKVGKLNDGQTIYRFNYKGDKTTQIGLMHDEVEHHHPEATGRQGGFGTVDYHKATEDAVRKARGGGVAGFASGGIPTPFANDAQSWVPQMGLTAGHGAPTPPQVHAPEAPKDQGMDPEKIMKGVGGLGKAFSNSSYGDATSDYAQDLADGDAGSFSTYFARGGGVRRYASGGTPGGGLPWLDDADAGWYAPDLIPTVAGFGASTPAVQSRAEDTPDIPGVYRDDVSPEAMNQWRGRTDRDTGRARAAAAIQQKEPPPDLKPAPVGEVMLAQNDNGVTVPGLAPRVNPRPLSAQEDMANAIHDDTVPAGEDSASAYAPEPRRGLGAPRPSPAPPAPDQQPQGGGGILGGLGIHLTPELRQGLLMAGLSMMATHRGGPGSFLGALGEGGISGVASYEKTLESARQQEAQQRKEDFERMKFERPFEQMTASEKYNAEHKGEMTDAQAAADKRAREAADFERKTSPYKVNPDGTVVPNDAVIDVTKKMAEAKRLASSMDDETAGFLADRVLAGDTRALVGLGRGAQGAENLGKIQQMVARKAASGEPVSEAARSILGNAAQQAGFVTAERTQAQIMAKLSVYGRTAYSAMDLALKASDEVPRTQFPKVNEAVNAWKSNTGDPAVKAFGQAVETLTNEYARAVGGGHGTVTDKEHARDRLNTAQTPEQFRAVVDMMKQEIVLAEHAMPEARKQIQGIYNPKAGEAAPSIEGTAGAAAPHTFLPQGGDVKQNGWWYRKQPDGSYTAVGPAQ